jgi:hypothetical protein
MKAHVGVGALSRLNKDTHCRLAICALANLFSARRHLLRYPA